MKTFVTLEDVQEVPEDIQYKDPILVTGTARSGTSLLAAVIQTCGAWSGNTIPASFEMPTGFIENGYIRQCIMKPLMQHFGADTLGQASVLEPDDITIDETLVTFIRRSCEAVAWFENKQDEQSWLIKDARLTAIYPFMEAVFPKARWLVVRRNIDDIVASCERTEFMHYRGDVDWRAWAETNEANIEHMKKNATCPITEIQFDDLRDYNFAEIAAFVETEEGLEWDAYEVESLIV
jgi:hypothetical protein